MAAILGIPLLVPVNIISFLCSGPQEATNENTFLFISDVVSTLCKPKGHGVR